MNGFGLRFEGCLLDWCRLFLEMLSGMKTSSTFVGNTSSTLNPNLTGLFSSSESKLRICTTLSENVMSLFPDLAFRFAGPGELIFV